MWYQFKKKERKRERERVNCCRDNIGKCFIGIFGIHASVLWCESTRLKISMYKTVSRFSKLLAYKLFWSKDKQNVAFCNLADSCGRPQDVLWIHHSWGAFFEDTGYVYIEITFKIWVPMVNKSSCWEMIHQVIWVWNMMKYESTWITELQQELK